MDDLVTLCDKARNGVIERCEVELAIEVWQRHLKGLRQIEPYFEKYDKDQSGRLDRQQLKQLLLDLNDGMAVEDSEVDWVLQHADLLGDGQIGKFEISSALSLWFHHVEEKTSGVPLGNHVEVRDHVAKRSKPDASKIGAKRREVQVLHMDEQEKISTLFEKYDKNKSGGLSKDELRALMEDIHTSVGMGGRGVEAQDVSDLMRMCDQAKDGVIDRGEVLFAVELWHKHLKAWPAIEPVFDKYDANQDGRLTKDQLRQVLLELNDGVEIDNRDIDWILKEADLLGDGYIGKLEMEHALSLWYHEVERRQLNSICCSVQ